MVFSNPSGTCSWRSTFCLGYGFTDFVQIVRVLDIIINMCKSIIINIL